MCSGCGQPVDECRDPATARQWQVDANQCQACRVLMPAMRDADPSQNGWYYGVHRNRP